MSELPLALQSQINIIIAPRHEKLIKELFSGLKQRTAQKSPNNYYSDRHSFLF